MKENRGGSRLGAGRKLYKPSKRERELVKIMSMTGVRHEAIAHCMGPEWDPGISLPTLRKVFKKELEFTPDKANGEVAKSLYHLATVKNNLGAIIFWLKCRAGWKENDSLQLNGRIEVVKRVIGVKDDDV